MFRIFRLAVGTVLLISVFAAGSLAATKAAVKAPDSVTITLTPSIDSPQYLGTSVTWTATVNNAPKGHIYDYRFTVALDSQLQIVRDFDLPNSFTWVPFTVEGNYQVIVTVRDITQVSYITYAPVSVQYTILPWVTQAGGSAVHPTSHPLVALFSGPPCQLGHYLLVRFRQVNSDVSTVTNSVPCSQKSANFYVAGMLPSTQYLMHWEEVAPGITKSGPDLSFTTGPLPANYPPTTFTVNVPPTQHDAEYPVVLFYLIGGHWVTATDLSGNVIWYLPSETLWPMRMDPGGYFFAVPNDYLSWDEYDFAGNLVLQTNVRRINEQLVALGYPTINDFNLHETRRLPNGNILLMGTRDMASTQYQGGTQENPVDIIGDMILILDHNMQLVWAWDSFAHEDLSRKATLNDICTHGAGGCPSFSNQFTQANDWLHTNSAQLTPDGNIVLSQRAQDWVIKVNYDNGQGDGRVLWRLGAYGDFTLLNPTQGCGDPNVFPWFTHQHDAVFQANGSGTQLGKSVFTVFDDGNTRSAQCGGGQDSRGMVLLLDEKHLTAYMQTAADLGAYSGALGSGDLLPASDGLYASYGNGLIGSVQDPFVQSTEVNLNGQIVYELQANSWSYRSYRMRNLYTVTWP